MKSIHAKIKKNLDGMMKLNYEAMKHIIALEKYEKDEVKSSKKEVKRGRPSKKKPANSNN